MSRFPWVYYAKTVQFWQVRGLPAIYIDRKFRRRRHILPLEC